jgi:hypothetical protein
MKAKAKPAYDEEELEILHALEAGALKPVSGMTQQILTHRAAAEPTVVHHRFCSEGSRSIETPLQIKSRYTMCIF